VRPLTRLGSVYMVRATTAMRDEEKKPTAPNNAPQATARSRARGRAGRARRGGELSASFGRGGAARRRWDDATTKTWRHGYDMMMT